MGDASPTAFQCTVLGWREMQSIACDVALAVSRDESFTPDVVVGLARGGWCPTRCVCDVLEQDDATSMKMEHYTGTASAGDEPSVRYPVAEDAVRGKDVLLVDDIVDTGASVAHAVDVVEQQGASSVQVAVLQALPDTEYNPAYVGEEFGSFAWVVYPWNVVEDVHDLIRQLSDGAAASYEYDALCAALERAYGLDAQERDKLPMSLDDILWTLDERGALSFDGTTVRLPS